MVGAQAKPLLPAAANPPPAPEPAPELPEPSLAEVPEPESAESPPPTGPAAAPWVDQLIEEVSPEEPYSLEPTEGWD